MEINMNVRFEVEEGHLLSRKLQLLSSKRKPTEMH